MTTLNVCFTGIVNTNLYVFQWQRSHKYKYITSSIFTRTGRFAQVLFLGNLYEYACNVTVLNVIISICWKRNAGSRHSRWLVSLDLFLFSGMHFSIYTFHSYRQTTSNKDMHRQQSFTIYSFVISRRRRRRKCCSWCIS